MKYTSSIKREQSTYTLAPVSPGFPGRFLSTSAQTHQVSQDADMNTKEQASATTVRGLSRDLCPGKSRQASGWWEVTSVLFPSTQILSQTAPFPLVEGARFSHSPTGQQSTGDPSDLVTSDICCLGFKRGDIILETVLRSHPHLSSPPLFSFSLNTNFETSLWRVFQ